MIELVPAEHDDVAFLSLVQRIINGAIASFEIRDVFLVHVDTWFDYKWLGWWSRREGDLRVPPFTPRRVRSEKRLLWDLRRSTFGDPDGGRWLSRSTGFREVRLSFGTAETL
jgi:hypothetical protein